MSAPKVYVKDRIYVPVKYVDEDLLTQNYQKEVYNEERCSVCPVLSDRHCETCDECPAYLGTFKMYNEKEIKGKRYYGISVGQKKQFSNVLTKELSDFKIRDKRCKTKFKHDIEFTGKLYGYQGPAVDKLFKKRYGILRAPPRSGKTVMLTALMCKLGLKTLIIANQYDYLEQFYETMCGSVTQEPLTNIPEIEGFINKKICGICSKVEDFEKYDVCLATYQQFINDKNGKKKLEQIKDLFGVVLVDECDLAPAEAYSKVLNAFSSSVRIGCTGTTDRKDGRFFLADHLFGPVTANVEVETLKPKVELIETGLSIKHDYKILAYAHRALAENKPRTQLIMDWVFHDLKQGRSIVIPVVTVKQCKDWVAMINKRAGKTIACAFTAATTKKKEDRKQIILDARSGKYKVIIGIRKMVQRGINVPRWDTLYEVAPISNTPSHIQEVSRILTPYKKKQEPLIRYFVDDFGFSRGCLRTCMWRTHVPLKHVISRADWDLAKKYTSKTKLSGIQPHRPGTSKRVDRPKGPKHF